MLIQYAGIVVDHNDFGCRGTGVHADIEIARMGRQIAPSDIVCLVGFCKRVQLFLRGKKRFQRLFGVDMNLHIRMNPIDQTLHSDNRLFNGSQGRAFGDKHFRIVRYDALMRF